MKKQYILILSGALLIAAGMILIPRGHKWARAHVNYKTAVEDHPLNCLSCHLYTSDNKIASFFLNANYLSPFNLAVSADGKTLYVIAEEAGSLLVVNAETKKVMTRIRVGNRPHSVILDKGQKLAYVSNQWSDQVSVIDLAKGEVTDTFATGNGPAGLALSRDEEFLYVVNSYSSDVSVIETRSGEEIKRLMAGNNPTGIEASADGTLLYVTSRRNQGGPYDDMVHCEMTVLADKNQRVSERKDMLSAHIMENVTFTPDGEWAMTPLIRPKNNIPSVQVERGWMMSHGIGIIEQKPGGRIIQLLLDEPNAYYSDPFDIVITPDGKRGFVSHSGVDMISVIDMEALRMLVAESTDDQLKKYSNHQGISSRFVIRRIPTGANPKGLALSPDGSRLYVAEHLDDKIGVINTISLETEAPIDLGGPKRTTVSRRGRRLLNNAGHTFQNQYACYTCHPDVHEDGLVYNMASKDMGRNLANTQSLRDIGDTPPFKWNGKNQTVYKQDGMRFSTVLTRTEPFSHKNLDALVAYIVTGVPYPPNLTYNPTGELNDMQLRGKALFERTHDNYGNEIPENNRCVTCHPAPFYTNLQMADVRTLAATDDSMLFDTPHLNNIYASAPYLHDGRAKTLEEIWTKYSPEDKHGAVNDFTKIQLNELIEYLKSLSSPDYYNIRDTKKTLHAKITH